MQLRYRNSHVHGTRNKGREFTVDFDINHRVEPALRTPTLGMAPKRYRPAKEVEAPGAGKASDKEELVQARATKRAERVKARYEEAEKHKEIVRGIVLLCFTSRKTLLMCRETRTFVKGSIERLLKHTKCR